MRLPERVSSKALPAIIVFAHVFLLAFSARQHSPTFNEIGHLPAGICHWRYRMFHLYRVNPPLPRMVAALPLLLIEPETDWTNYGMSPFSREVIPVGIRFVRANGPDTFRLFTIGRWASIPFSLLGALVCYRWASELWGRPSGLLALVLWCVSPTILGHGALVMPDVPAAAMGIAASYLFWKWLREPGWGRAVAAGGALGLAELCKTTLILLFFIWPVLWCLFQMNKRGLQSKGRRLGQAAMIVVMIAIAIYVVNLGYAFSGSCKRLRSFQFQSRLLGGGLPGETSGNRFAQSWLGALRVPVPADYVQGIDRQRTDFELTDRSYLRENWKQGGWWYYYLYALAIKVPLGTWLVLSAAVFASLFHRKYSASFCDELCLVLPAVAIIALVSSQAGFSNHMRYVIPAFPFLFVWMSKVGRAVALRDRMITVVTLTSLAWAMISSLSIYPHSISYFNELVGGPKNGHAHLLYSNIAWGQDLLYLRRWLDEHPEARPIRVASFGWIDPRLVGIEFSPPPVGPSGASASAEAADECHLGPMPGWYALDVNFLHGTHWPTPNGEGLWTDVATNGFNYEYFQHFAPVAMAGYSIYIYHITLDEVNRVRRKLGLPELAGELAEGGCGEGQEPG